MKFLKIKVKYLFILFLLFINFFLNNQVQASNKLEGIENFPISYQPYLLELKKHHSNWNFIALYTNLDWNYSINKENQFGINLIPKSYSDSWKNHNENVFNIEIESGWVDSSRQAVEYCMDPRNFLNELQIFQFEELSYNSKTNNLEGIEKVLYGTDFYKRKVSYLDNKGNVILINKNYSDLILNAAQISKVNSYHLASRIKQEVGPFLNHNSISGNVENFEGLYNFYNIGATTSSDKMQTIINGLMYAKDGKGANEEIKDKYLIPWNTVEKAITGGAIFIGSSYINVGQNTIYLQKFDVNDERKNSLFWHQYMTNILAPYNESKSIYNGYEKMGLLDSDKNFIIPIYQNMPKIPIQNPTIDDNEFIEEYVKAYCNATNVNIRTGPGLSYEVITKIPKDYKITRIMKGNQLGEKWDKIILENGIVGFINQKYVSIEENNDSTINDEIQFIYPLTEKNMQVTGLLYSQNTVRDIRENIITNLEIQFINNQNKFLSYTDKIGTGCKLKFVRDGNVEKEFEIILYGDVNGDGKINSVDLLVLQRHILEIQRLDDIFIKAGNISKNGKKPSSVDLLLIQRHILGLKIIDQ